MQEFKKRFRTVSVFISVIRKDGENTTYNTSIQMMPEKDGIISFAQSVIEEQRIKKRWAGGMLENLKVIDVETGEVHYEGNEDKDRFTYALREEPKPKVKEKPKRRKLCLSNN